jgi:hypothetical protein
MAVLHKLCNNPFGYGSANLIFYHEPRRLFTSLSSQYVGLYFCDLKSIGYSVFTLRQIKSVFLHTTEFTVQEYLLALDQF